STVSSTYRRSGRRVGGTVTTRAGSSARPSAIPPLLQPMSQGASEAESPRLKQQRPLGTEAAEESLDVRGHAPHQIEHSRAPGKARDRFPHQEAVGAGRAQGGVPATDDVRSEERRVGEQGRAM